MTKNSSDYNIVIDPTNISKEYFKDLFRYRELFYFFSWRDIVVRYKQTALGIIWAVIRPLINMVVFAFIFGKVAKLPSDNVNYPLFVLAGMLPWQLFANSLLDCSNCLVNNSHMISKVYFPRIILPISQIIVQLIDMLISLAMLLTLLLFTGHLNSLTMLALPFFIGLTLLLSLGTGLFISASTVRYRDFRFIIPFVVQFGVFISPVGYGTFLIPEHWRWIYCLNPMVGIIEGFRWCCFGIYHPDLPLTVALSCAVIVGILAAGFRFFRKMERIFADII
jgi:lipopolysaccharide transport system permease protein